MKKETITLGAGHFYSLDPLFSEFEGIKVTCGYAGGIKDNPTHEMVMSSDIGYA